jgi:hypothetical protein
MSYTDDLTDWAIDVEIPSHPKISRDRIRLVLVVLVTHGNARTGLAFPAAVSIGDRLGYFRRDVTAALAHLEEAGIIRANGTRRRGVTPRWSFAADIEPPVENPDEVSGKVSGEVSGKNPGRKPGNVSALPDMNQNRNQELNHPRDAGERRAGFPEHKHEPNSARALARIIRERNLPTTLDQALTDAYRLGKGDPWKGFEQIAHATERDFRTGAFDPAAVYQSRINTPRAS